MTKFLVACCMVLHKKASSVAVIVNLVLTKVIPI